MADTGTVLGVDLYELWRAGRDNIPTVAREYALANGRVADTDDGLAAAFWRPVEFGGSARGPAYPAWTGLRDELQTMLGDTSANLDLVAEALCLAVVEYAKTDAEAAAELERLQRVNGDDDAPPVVVPAPRYPSVVG